MAWYQALLVVGACTAGLLAWNVPRALMWIGMGALSFLASHWWHDAGLPYGAAFGAATNLAICYMLYAFAERRWEMRVWNCFHLMIVLDLMYMGGLIKSHYAFAVSLEIANWLALAVIGATGILERLRNGSPHHDLGWGWAGALHRALYEKRKSPPFWEIP